METIRTVQLVSVIGSAVSSGNRVMSGDGRRALLIFQNPG